MSRSVYVEYTGEEWGRLRADTPLTLTEDDLRLLRGINERVSLREVEEIYLPLSRLLNLHVAASQDLYRASATFLGTPAGKVPYVIGLAGSVAAGKSTTARVLQALLSRWTHHPRVEILATDGFLLPNAVLEVRGLLRRKGFPESYDRRALLEFLSELKAGTASVSCPVYSHLTYDIVPGARFEMHRPDVVIVEGLNVLQPGQVEDGRYPQLFVSDFFDFSIYVHAEIGDVRRWYVERFLALRDTAFQDPASYFRRYAALSDAEATATASAIWSEINEANLLENILPTRERADLILWKGASHRVQRVSLRKL